MNKRLTRAQEVAEALTHPGPHLQAAKTKHQDLVVSVARELERAIARRRKAKAALRAAEAEVKDRKLALRRVIAAVANRDDEGGL